MLKYSKIGVEICHLLPVCNIEFKRAIFEHHQYFFHVEFKNVTYVQSLSGMDSFNIHIKPTLND